MATENAPQSDGMGETEETGGNSIIAALLSGFLPGLGHYVAGLKGRSLYWFAGYFAYITLSVLFSFIGVGLLFLFAAPVLHLFALIDAYVQTG